MEFLREGTLSLMKRKEREHDAETLAFRFIRTIMPCSKKKKLYGFF
jgi:hypothetical protein